MKNASGKNPPQESCGVYRSVRGVHSALCVRVEALVRAGGAAVIAAALRLALRLGERVAAVGPRRRVDFARRRLCTQNEDYMTSPH